METRPFLLPVFLLFLLALSAGLLFPSGCAAPNPDEPDLSGDDACPPAWAVHPPQSDTYIYAVGWSGRTYRPSKAREQALQRAVAMLAAQAMTYVKNEAVLWQDKDRVIASDSLTETQVNGVVKGFTIVAERRCEGPDVPESLRGSVYILIRIPKAVLRPGSRP